MQPLLLALEVAVEHTRILEPHYQLLHADSPGRALELRPDLILAGSLEICRGLPQVPRVLLVGADLDEEIPSGFLDVLVTTRPLQMRSRIARLLDHLQQRRRLQSDLDSLIYAVSHDLRAPLRAVSGFSELLMSEFGAALGPDGQHYLERVCNNSQRLSEMMEDLLSLARLFRDPLKPRELDVTEMVQQIVDPLRAAQPTATLTVAVQADLRLRGDRRLLRAVWEALLNNAWKFARSRIEVGRGSDGFYVRDDGIGYDPNKAEHLFSPFQQLHRGAVAGRGMGLATAARIVAGLGGQIWSESTPGLGATFYFSLPDLEP